MNRLFVYGTLMRGQVRADLLGDAPRVAATTHGRLYHLPPGYPAIVDVPEGVVHGELVTIDPASLPALDDYEGDEYRRVVRVVATAEGPVDAWCYVFPPEDEAAWVAAGAVGIPSGRWA